MQNAFLEALGRVRKITRRPKPVRALRIALAADLQAVEPSPYLRLISPGGRSASSSTVTSRMFR